MEEDSGVKAAPVTRLRRRLSVEQSDDTKSPSVSAPSTPTKKRGGRLAAKPQLELIDENAIQNSPKRATRKSVARDIIEAEEKPLTPARRNTRVKSNTSLVSETEEKVLTPSRRSTRIKSNTSIVLDIESTQGAVETPRAKRAAARRNSQAGATSASETAVTPGRNRRTRKGSTSSIDTPVEGSQTDKPVSLITEVISEEPETQLRKSTENSEQENVENRDDSPSLRKSPRLAKNLKSKGRKSDALENVKELQNENKIKENYSAKSTEQKDSENNEQQSHSLTEDIKTLNVPDATENNVSISSINLIKNLEPAPKKKTSKNKSYSDIETSDSANKRHRTKSWTTLCATPLHEGNFYSDNENTIKKLKKHGKVFKVQRQSESGDGAREKVDLQEEEVRKVDLNDSKRSKKSSQNNVISDSKTPITSVNDKSITDVPKEADISNESNKENLLGVVPSGKDSATVELIFDKPPTGEVTSLVFMEDSDSNTDILGKQEKEKDVVDGEDQCVPVVLHTSSNKATSEQSVFAINTVDEVDSNTSCEPMDIDETMPENVSLTEGKQSRKSSLSMPQDDNQDNNKRKSTIASESKMFNKSSSMNKSIKEESFEGKRPRKSSLCLPREENEIKSKRKSSNSISENLEKSATVNKSVDKSLITSNIKSLSKSCRKSSLSIQEADSISKDSSNMSERKSSNTQDFEKSGNENKSTLVLSQIKDLSSAETSVSKSPQIKNISQSMNIEVKDGPVNKNLALDYSTSTPVQQKNVEKLNMQMNTSVITPTNKTSNKIKHTSKNMSKNNMSIESKSSDNDSSDVEETEDSENESSQEKSNLLIAEAEDAGEDYESGDSQDEDERQYEIENEIVDRGESLTSEEDFSNDSDYEKDSFIVSSNEEDNELLSGSEDDLNMSDNELTMSAKSKKKFNDRKEKQQKKASKEMYEARHGLNESEKSDKSETKPQKKNNRLRLDSTLLESDNDNMVPPKKNKRMRLESTLDSSQDKTDSEDKTTKQDTSIAPETEKCVHKKKKRLYESVSNESSLNEKEITITNDNAPADDPLIVKIKPEPKTPQKDFEISLIHFTDRKEIEQVGIDENVSMIKANETSDPLHKTMAQDDEDSNDDDSISENEDITNNYESMLKELNKETTKQVKTQDISLNLENKVNNKKNKPALLDELNLTLVKNTKNNSLQPKEKTIKRMFKKLADTDDSDSVDLRLLFSDDSNHNEKGDENIEKVTEIEERIIPLKRTKGNTNIPANSDTDKDDIDGELNTSNKKSKNRKSVAKNSDTDDKIYTEEALPFFIDTKGDLSDNEPAKNTSLNTSNQKKNKNKSVQNIPIDDIGLVDEADSNDAPAEVSYVSEKNKKGNKKLLESTSDIIANTTDDSNAAKTSGSKKKKKNKLSESKDTAVTDNIVIGAVEALQVSKENLELSEVFINKSLSSKKKSKKCLEHQNDEVQIEIPTTSPASGKKNKHKESEVAITEIDNNIKLDKTDKATKDNEIQIVNEKKKRKRKSSANVTIEEMVPESAPVDIETQAIQNLNESVGNKKKKLKASNSAEHKIIAPSNVCQIQGNKTDELQGSNESVKKDKLVKSVKPEQSKAIKKRKERDDDGENDQTSKVLKENSFDKIHVSRLPSNLINQLEDKPRKDLIENKKTAKFTSTTDFIVEETITKRSKPSSFLEETVYLNDNDDGDAQAEKKSKKVKKPKVLPFLPTVSTSDSGFTTNFQVNVISQKMEFMAQRNEVSNFKNDYLQEKRIKKMRTYDLYKKHRNVKLSKF